MKTSIVEFKDEVDALIEFLISDTWEFYGTPNPKPERIRASYENHYYTGDDCKTFWIYSEQNTVGIIRIYDLQDGTPMFDIRILSKYKGKGFGTTAVTWLVNYIFNNHSTRRIEANTRQDNYAMRCVFHKCGFVKEAYHRRAWENNDGTISDAVGYAITKEDWQNGKATPIDWNDFKC